MRTRRAEGWVLLETLVAMVLLSVGVLAINRALREAVQTRAIARDYTTARFLLDEKMGELDMQPVLREGDTGAGSFGPENGRFSFTWSIAKVEMPAPPVPADVRPLLLEPPKLPEPYLGRIAVAIKWTRAGREYDASGETLISSKRLKVLEVPSAPAPPTS